MHGGSERGCITISIRVTVVNSGGLWSAVILAKCRLGTPWYNPKQNQPLIWCSLSPPNSAVLQRQLSSTWWTPSNDFVRPLGVCKPRDDMCSSDSLLGGGGGPSIVYRRCKCGFACRLRVAWLIGNHAEASVRQQRNLAPLRREVHVR